MFVITWNELETSAQTGAEVMRVIEALHLECIPQDPVEVTVESAESHDSLSIGVGRGISVLNFVRGDRDPPYYISKGDNETDSTVSFRFGGEWSEYSVRNAVPISAALHAMNHFCDTGTLTEEIQWEEV